MATFIEHDGGRSAAGYKGSARDCAVRAAAIVLSMPYASTYEMLQERQKAFKARSRRKSVKLASASPRTGVWREVMHGHMIEHGAQWVPLSTIGGEVFRVKDVAERWPSERLIMRLGKHYSAMIDGVNLDTWQQHPMKRVYGVWIA